MSLVISAFRPNNFRFWKIIIRKKKLERWSVPAFLLLSSASFDGITTIASRTAKISVKYYPLNFVKEGGSPWAHRMKQNKHA